MKWIVILVEDNAATEIFDAYGRGALFLKERHIEADFPYLDLIVAEPGDTIDVPEDWT